MRKIDESKITSDKSMFFKQGTWTHLQKAYIEAIDALARVVIKDYDPTKVYILYGCVNSTTAPIYTITAGAVYYAGEVYLVDAVTFTSTGANVAVATIATTNNTTDYSADPCEFSDGSLENVHNIRKVVIATGTAGTGISDFSNFLDNGNAHKSAYVDITSTVTLNTAVWAGTGTTFTVRKYEDGTVSVNAWLYHAATVAQGIGIFTGLPVPSTGGIQIVQMADDIGASYGIHNCALGLGSGALTLRTAITTTGVLAYLNFTYKA